MGDVRKVDEISTGDNYVVYRACSDAADRTVVIKTLARGRGDVASAARLRHEYQLLAGLDVPGVVRPLGLQDVDGVPALVLEPAGALDLGARLRQGRLDVREFLDLAVQMATSVGHVHSRNVVHRDLSPAKFVLDEDGTVTLVGFEFATALSGRINAGELEGTLAYLAPEQTGWSRRAVDHRADLYALGATFYEMLVGSPPFSALGPAELVHAHLATRPVSPTVRNAAIPILLSELVLKLLAKMPEERYQSAAGLAADLEDARRQWHATGAIKPFLLGREDLARELPLPDRLFGRERERAALFGALHAAAHGERQVVFVSGPAGVGKSALVETLARSVEAQGGRFAAGKSDQLRSNVPMAPFIQAFGHAIGGLLSLPLPARTTWSKRIVGVLDGSGKLVTELLPEFDRLVGAQASVPALGPAETENRLHRLLSALVRVLAEDGPLVLFLDDLQWADASTLKFLRHLSTEEPIAHLLIVVAYRSERAGSAPEQALAAIREGGTTVTSLALAPLDLDAVTALLAETLRSNPPDVAEIARAVHAKTRGNPLFVRRLLRFLWQAKLLAYDRRTESYAWNRTRIAELPVTENVADLLVAGIQRLPDPTRQLLEYAACIGMRFDLRELAAVTGYRPDDAGQALWSALHEGFLVSVNGTSARATEPEPGSAAPPPTAAYTFAHDRIREAAYAMLEAPERRRRHLNIGRSLLDLPPSVIERRIFEIADQLNRGVADMTAAERLRLAELDLLAGRKAKASAAYGAGLAYLSHGLSALAPDAPRRNHALWFALHRDGAECAYLSGDHARCRALVEAGRVHAETELERAALSTIRLLTLTAQGSYGQAVALSREALHGFGIDVPELDLDVAVEREFENVESALADRRPMDLLELPAVTDTQTLATLSLLAHSMSAAYTLESRLFIWFGLRTMRHCLERGCSVYMPRACADYAVVLVMRGQYARAHEFGRLAIELCARIGNRTEESKVLFIVAGSVDPWCEPLLKSVQPLRLASSRAFETGELLYAGLAATFVVHFLFIKGARLDAVLGELEQCQAFLRKVAHRSANDLLLPYRQALRVLKGHIISAPQFEDEEFQEASFLARVAPVMVFYYATLRMQVAYLMGDLGLAIEMSNLAERHHAAAANTLQRADFHFYTALTLAAVADSRAPAERTALLVRIEDSQAALARWAESCPANFCHKRELVAAERAWLEGKALDAERLYESAIRGAQRGGFLQDEALARERYGRFCLAHGLELAAGVHLTAALQGYGGWGAAVKARMLEAECAAIGLTLDGRRKAERMPARLSSTAGLELGSLLEAAATLTAELVLPQFLDKLLRLALELSGAERGALVVQDAGEALVRATGSAIGVTLDERPLAASEELPRSIAEHVLQTGAPVVLGDAANEGGFGADPYVRRHQLKSVLALPLRRTARSAGVLYLENNLATLVFTPERVQSLELLSGQIGAALDNARLVRQLEDNGAQARFLADVSATLAESLDYETTIRHAVRLAVPRLAEMCLVDMVEGKEIRAVATLHADPDKAALLREYRRRYPVDWNSPHPATRVLRSGCSLLFSEITTETRLQNARDAEHARLAGVLRMRSGIVTPLIARGRTLGAITLVSTRPFYYREQHLAHVEEFAHRVALAIDNARSYRQSEDSVHARDDFLSVASHELRTPVAALELTIQGLTRGVLPATPEMLKRTTHLIERQVGRLAQLIEQLLSVSRIQAGRLELQTESVDLVGVVRTAIERLHGVIATSGSRVVLDAPEPVVGCWDTSALEQVATNLLTNALKFGRHNPIEVRVEKLDQRAHLRVRDRGVGIPAERLPHIFERFERAVSAREFGGLGLGLFIARSIVAALGGSIRVESQFGEGSVFIVDLPCTGPNQGRDP